MRGGTAALGPDPSWPVTLDMSPTKHVVWLGIAALLCVITLISAARAHMRGRPSAASGRRTGFGNGMEAFVLFLRNEVVVPNVGPHGEKYVPFILTLFFFILFANLCGLHSLRLDVTGNIAVTGTLAIVTFIVVEIAGMRALGAGYLGTIFYWPHDMPLAMKMPMTLIMTPVEISESSRSRSRSRSDCSRT